MQLTYRWIEVREATDEEWQQVDAILARMGWMSLNRSTSRILVAETDGRIEGFSCVQLFPGVGPLYVRPKVRGSGVAEELADRTINFLVEVQARGWIVVADSPFTEKLCQERNMERIESPVYVTGGAPSEDS
jgi:hypothetical protein